MNKKYAVFGVAAVIAIAGVIYFGTSANQQASIAALKSTVGGTKPVGTIPVIEPVSTSPNLSAIQWRRLCRDRQPHIEVLSPNGGEVYSMNQKINLKWKSCNASGLHMFFGMSSTLTGNNNEVSANSLDNDGNELITIPSWAITGNYYKMYVSLNGSPILSDYSDNTFTINEITGLSTTLASLSTPIITVNTSGAVTSALYHIQLNVTANGNDFYIPRGASFVRGTNTTTVPSLSSPQNGISFGILDGSNTYVDGSTAGNISTPASEISSAVSLISGATIDPSGRIKVSAGQTAVFDLAVTISEGVTPQDVAGQYKVGVLSVNGATTPTGTISNFNTTPIVNYQTQFNSPAFQ